MASSPMADAATTSGSVVGCLRSTTLQLGPNRRMIRPKAIAHSPPTDFAICPECGGTMHRIAAVPRCSNPQPFRCDTS